MKTTRGYTLVETMLGLAILLFLSAALLGIYLQFGKIYSLGQSGASSVNSARTALNGLIVYTTQADSIVTSRTIAGITYTTNTTTLVLRLPATDVSGSTLPTSDYVIYTATSSLLYRIIDPGSGSARASSTKVVNNSLSTVSFAYNASPITSSSMITAYVEAYAQNGLITTTSSASETILLRNYE